jgi:CheY-like chemotaxis protein
MNPGELRSLLETAACRHARTILLTSALSGGSIEADARLIKPVKPSDLLALMAHLSTPEPQTVGPGPAQLPARPLRILLAEDNPVNQVVASRMLEKRGHTVQIAKDGEQAVILHTSAEFDLILMDMQMPRMNGPEASRAIRQRERGSARRTPIVALTANSTEEGYRSCCDAGMDGHLIKPIRESQLMDMVAGIARKPD